MAFSAQVFNRSLNLAAKALEQAAPFLLGLAFITIPSSPLALSSFITAYLYFLLLFCLWKITRSVAFMLLIGKDQGALSPRQKKFSILGLMLLAPSTVMTLHLFESHNGKSLGFAALALLGIGALADAMHKRKQANASSLLILCYATGIASLSIALCAGAFYYHFFAFAFGLACCRAASELWLYRDKIWSRSIKLLYFAAPGFVSVFAYLQVISARHLVLFSIIPLGITVVEHLGPSASENVTSTSKRISPATITLLYLVLLFVIQLH
jgi:hypothetical protein